MAKVPKSSGQGTSRKAYQTGYRGGMRGTGAPSLGDAKPLRAPAQESSGPRSYGKGDVLFHAPKDQPFKTEVAPDLVPFGVSNLKAIDAFPGKKPKGLK
jgi:hypothetical protein